MSANFETNKHLTAQRLQARYDEAARHRQYKLARNDAQHRSPDARLRVTVGLIATAIVLLLTVLLVGNLA